jgi:hypothetical protein
VSNRSLYLASQRGLARHVRGHAIKIGAQRAEYAVNRFENQVRLDELAPLRRELKFNLRRSRVLRARLSHLQALALSNVVEEIEIAVNRADD